MSAEENISFDEINQACENGLSKSALSLLFARALVEYRGTDVLKQLIRYGAEVSADQVKNITPFPSVLREYMKTRPDLRGMCRDTKTRILHSLHFNADNQEVLAANNGVIHYTKRILKSGYDLNYNDGMIPLLWYAVTSNEEERIKFLVSWGGDTRSPSFDIAQENLYERGKRRCGEWFEEYMKNKMVLPLRSLCIILCYQRAVSFQYLPKMLYRM